MNLQTIQLILESLLILLGLYMAFVKSYVQEKGKNLATKQDIEGITQKVESVKTEFQVLSHSRTTINQEKRNSFLKYYDSYFSWLNIVLDSTYGSIDQFKNEEIEKHQSRLNSMYLDMCNSEARMQLWNDNIELLSIADAVKVETYNNFYVELNLHLIELKQINLEIQENEKTPPELRPSLALLLNKSTDSQIKYVKSVNKKYLSLVDTLYGFTQKSREYLISIN
ncbi:MAG: hypothetical protein KF744_04695 [Taibaiella sp.]|nr:hypothetical protein [Taibaiella sp.]